MIYLKFVFITISIIITCLFINRIIKNLFQKTNFRENLSSILNDDLNIILLIRIVILYKVVKLI